MNNARLAKNSILYFVAMTLPKATGLVLLPLYSIYIAPDEFGIYGYIATIITFMAVLSSLALNAFYLRFYPIIEDKKQLNGTIFWFMCLWNFFLLIAALLTMPALWRCMNISVPYMPYVPIALVGQFFNSMEIIPMRTYRIKGEANYYLLRILAKCVLTLACTIIFIVWLRMGVIGRFYSDFLNALIFAVIFIAYMWRNSYFAIDWLLLKRALKFSLPIVPSDLLTAATPLCNSIVIEKILPLAQLGIFSMSTMIGGAVQLITMSISLTLEPEYYLKAASSEFPQYARKLKNFQMVFISMFCVAFGLIVRDVIMLVLSEKYWESWKAVQFLSISYVVAVIQGVCVQLVIVQGRTHILIWANLANVMTAVVANIMFLSLAGPELLGVANIIGYVFSFAILYHCVNRDGFEDMNYVRDFCVVGLVTFVILASRMLDASIALVYISLKSILFLIFVLVLLRIYKIKLHEIVNMAKAMQK